MRASPSRRNDKEIIGAIIKETGDRSVEPLIKRRISDLRACLPPFTGNRTDNVEYANDLREQIIDLQRTLKKPQSFLLKARFWQLWDAQGTGIEINPQTRDWIAQEPAPLTRELNWLHELCDAIIEYKPGKHGNTEHQHIAAAIVSSEVLEAVALHAGRKFRLHFSPTGKFIKIARLFHEAVTGERDADLERACKTLKAHLDTKTQK